jgi:type VI secretion system secreted protein Hcp
MAKADIFLKLESSGGPVTGESNAPDHKDEIEIFEWSWGMTGSQALGGSPGQTARTALSEIRFGKGCDAATTKLMTVMRNNAVVTKAVLTVRKAGVTPPVEYLIVTVKKGRITSHSIGTRAPDDPELVESFSIAFEEIEVKYATQLTTGSKSAQMVFNASVND